MNNMGLLKDSLDLNKQEILEGKSRSYLTNQNELKVNEISHILVYDQTGRRW
jgi:hypothetical protein